MSTTSGWGRFTWGQAEWNEDTTLKTGWGAQQWSGDGGWEIFLIKLFLFL